MANEIIERREVDGHLIERIDTGTAQSWTCTKIEDGIAVCSIFKSGLSGIAAKSQVQQHAGEVRIAERERNGERTPTGTGRVDRFALADLF